MKDILTPKRVGIIVGIVLTGVVAFTGVTQERIDEYKAAICAEASE